MTKYILVYGNVCDGFTFVGPFDSHDDALAYAEWGSPDYESWCIATLDAPPVTDVEAE